MFARIAAIAFLLPALVSAVAIPDPQGAPGMGTVGLVGCPQGCGNVASMVAGNGNVAKHSVAVCIDGGKNKFYYVNGRSRSDKWEAASVACDGNQGCQNAVVNNIPDL